MHGQCCPGWMTQLQEWSPWQLEHVDIEELTFATLTTLNGFEWLGYVEGLGLNLGWLGYVVGLGLNLGWL